MELKQLRFFLAVAETLNFTRAAERVGIAQPPLSQRIRALERELGAELFKRTKRSVALTKAGEALLIHARRMMNASENAVSQVRAVRAGQLGVLQVGAIFSAIYNWMPATLRILSSTSPGIQVNLREMTIPNQLRALREGEIDVGLLRPPLATRASSSSCCIGSALSPPCRPRTRSPVNPWSNATISWPIPSSASAPRSAATTASSPPPLSRRFATI